MVTISLGGARAAADAWGAALCVAATCALAAPVIDRAASTARAALRDTDRAQGLIDDMTGHSNDRQAASSGCGLHLNDRRRGTGPALMRFLAAQATDLMDDQDDQTAHDQTDDRRRDRRRQPPGHRT